MRVLPVGQRNEFGIIASPLFSGSIPAEVDPSGFRTSLDFADALLEESRVAVTPGEAFDAPGFIRISYATSMENLREGSKRLLEFVARHAPQTAAAS